MAGRVIKGVSWSAIQQFSTQAVQFVVTIVLARLLTPAEFGIVATSMILLSILQVINETGFGAALMQKQDKDETDFFSVFILNICMGVFLYAFVFITAPLWSILFKEPGLTPVIKLLGLNLIFGSLMVVQRTKLLIKVDFKTWTKASLGGAIVSGIIGIILAYHGFGVYSLVVQSLSSTAISTLAIWLMVKWKPNYIFSLKRLKPLFQFAYKLIAARVINSIFNEIYSSVIALVYNPSQLAFFNRAKSFESISANNIVTIVQRVSIPLMCEEQNSEVNLRELLLKFIRYTGFIIVPLLSLLCSLSNPLIICLLTEKWIESAHILRIICVAGFFYNISAFNMNIYNATGRTDLALKCEIVKKIISIAIIGVAVLLRNFEALVWSYTICAIVECILNTIFTHSQIHAPIWLQIRQMIPMTIIGISVGTLCYFGTFIIHNPFYQLFGLGLFGIIAYLALCYLMNVADFRNLVNSKLKKKPNKF